MEQEIADRQIDRARAKVVAQEAIVAHMSTDDPWMLEAENILYQMRQNLSDALTTRSLTVGDERSTKDALK